MGNGRFTGERRVGRSGSHRHELTRPWNSWRHQHRRRWMSGTLAVLVVPAVVALTGGCAVVPAGACDGFYPANYTLTAGTSTDPIAAMVKPARGARFSEPAYHTCVVRVTNHPT